MTRAALLLGPFVAVLSAQTVSSATDTVPLAPTFTKDVAPILYASCAGCHRPGEVAPMSLLSYDEVRPWAKSIRRKVTSREMPPWGADPHYGKFKDDRSLSDAQIQTIAQWVDAGAPKGRDADLPPVPALASGWSRGEPDVVIEMPVDFAIPAEGEVPVIDFFTRAPFSEDVYVKALEVRPGTAGVIHHAGLYVIDKLPEGARLVNGKILGADGKVAGVRLRNLQTGESRILDVTGVFVAIGHDPRNELFKGQIELDDEGYVKVDDPSTRTNVRGVFAAGDLVDHTYRQAITASGTGCAAALDAERFIASFIEL